MNEMLIQVKWGECDSGGQEKNGHYIRLLQKKLHFLQLLLPFKPQLLLPNLTEGL